MSKANGAIENTDTFLQHVSLKNYKSIKDVEIDFKPGLNVIIGKNASGKTNFINGLNTIIGFNFDDILEGDFFISYWFKNKSVEIRASVTYPDIGNFVNNNDYGAIFDHDVALKIGDEQIEVKDDSDARLNLSKRNYIFNKVLIKYGIYYNDATPLINSPFSFILINNRKISRDMMSIKMDYGTEFIQAFINRIFISIVRLSDKENEFKISTEDLKNQIISYCEAYFENINDLIFNYSPVKAIRINPDFNLIKDELGQRQIITNFFIEFLIDNNWLTFALLSDGTKRLFYIISEILSINNNRDLLADNSSLSVILLEEPELGIHPHQLHQLMQFIKEQSREKQIIITTHSPQVLDVLGPDELDRIIICHSDPKNGTQLTHLTDKEINKAKKYMKEEAFLSDYWRFSDLEPAS